MSSKKYLEDFLSDEEFVRWVRSSDPELEEFWTRWSLYHPEMLETMLLAKEVILSFGEDDNASVAIEANETREEILRNLLTSPQDKIVEEQPVKYKSKPVFFNGFMKVAAVLLFCFGLSILAYHFNAPEDYYETNTLVKENKKGRMQTYLPDGTMVWLNSETRIAYSSHGKDQIREVILVGEAYFNVKKDSIRPFVVRSKNFSTTALGTSFNVSAYPEENEVTISLEEGKVQVKKNEHSGSYILTPGTQLVYSEIDHEVNIRPFDAEVEMGWIEGVLLFKNASFDEVMRALERFYMISIKIEGAKPEWNYTGRFANVSLEQVLKRLVAVEQFKFILKEENLMIWIE